MYLRSKRQHEEHESRLTSRPETDVLGDVVVCCPGSGYGIEPGAITWKRLDNDPLPGGSAASAAPARPRWRP